MQPEHRSHPGSAPGLELPQAGGLSLLRRSLRLDPAKHLLDPLTGVDGLGITLMANGAAVDGGAAAGLDVLGDMRRDAREAQISDEIPGVVVT
jgi:hypothetical protein